MLVIALREGEGRTRMLGYSMLLALSGTSANSGAWQAAAGDESPAGRNARADNLS